jgi:hypothetical protein
MNSILWSLVPNSAFPLILIGVALAVIIGFVKPRQAGSIIGFFIFSILLAPFFDILYSMLPNWLSLLLTIGFSIAILRALAALVIGRHAADHMTGILAADVVHVVLRAVFRFFFFPLRLLGRLVR